ncbi:MAG TPA: hypothetical protein VGN16_03995 [Acidobacteriaceae bacterium]|jgi:hypothetical protein
MTVDRKVMAGGVAGAVAVIACWALELAGVPVPTYIALAFQTIAVFALQFVVPNKEISNDPS